MTFDLRWALVQQPTPGGCIKTDYVGITKIQTVLTRQMHTVTKAKRNVQKLHLPGIELTISSQRPKEGALDHSATELVCRFGSNSDS